MAQTIEIEGLKELRRDIKAAESKLGRDVTKGLKRAGEPALSKAQGYAPKRSGATAASGRVRASGASASMIFSMPAPVLEFASQGQYASLTDKYGPPPRFGHKALEESADQIIDDVTKELNDALTIGGWAK